MLDGGDWASLPLVSANESLAWSGAGVKLGCVDVVITIVVPCAEGDREVMEETVLAVLKD